MKLLILSMLSATAAFGAGRAAVAPVFQHEEVRLLDGSEEKVQVLFHALRPDLGAEVQPPPGIAGLLPAMHQKKVWRDADEGMLSEARVWQAPQALLYEFFEITRRTYPQAAGGASASPQALARNYEDNRERFVMALDRLKGAGLWDSFDGKGRLLLAAYDAIRKEMQKLHAAVGADWPAAPDSLPRYRAAVLSVARLSDEAYAELERKGPDGPSRELQ